MFGASDKDKLNALKARIDKAQEAADPMRKKNGAETGKQKRAFVKVVRVGSDFVALVVLSTALGWFLDRQIETAPWFMIVMLFCGVIAGFWMIIRTMEDKVSPETADDKET